MDDMKHRSGEFPQDGDPLERSLRDVLTSTRHSLPSDLVPLERVHAGAVRRQRRRTAAVGAACALLAAAVAVPVTLRLADNDGGGPAVATSPTAQQSPQSSPEQTPSSSPASSSPEATSSQVVQAAGWNGAEVVSMTATSTRTLLVLGGARRCPEGHCLRLARSSDGGTSFTAVPTPVGVDVAGTDPGTGTVSDVRFGSTTDGWLFGDGLWSTHDGGRHWSRQRLPGRVVHLAAARGRVWALVTDGVDSPRVRLWTSPVDGDSWARVRNVSATAPAALAVSGTRVVVAGAESTTAWVGQNGAFAARRGPCPASLGVRLSATTAFWATCVTGTGASIAVSDDGISWHAVPVRIGDTLPNSVVLGARTGDDAVIDVGPTASLEHLSAGDSVTASSSGPPARLVAAYIGFTSPSVGYAVTGGDLWRTDDGGDTWQALSIG